MHLCGKLLGRVSTQKQPQLAGEFEFATATPAHPEVLLQRRSFGTLYGSIQKAPELSDCIRASDHPIPSFSNPFWTA
jgi:hypothetical protein